MLGCWHSLKASVRGDRDLSLKSRLIIHFCIVSNKVSHWSRLQLTWVEDGAGTAVGGPGLWVKGNTSPLDLHLRVLIQHLLDLDLHLCVRAFVVG